MTERITTSEEMRAECAKRDADGVPLDAAVTQIFGCRSWTDWAEQMLKPNPILMGMKFVEVKAEVSSSLPYRYVPRHEMPPFVVEQSAADEGRETYRFEHPKRDPSPARLPGDAHG